MMTSYTDRQETVVIPMSAVMSRPDPECPELAGGWTLITITHHVSDIHVYIYIVGYPCVDMTDVNVNHA